MPRFATLSHLTIPMDIHSACIGEQVLATAAVATMPATTDHSIWANRQWGASMKKSGSKRRVLFLEYNEITWTLLDRFIGQGKMPSFARIKEEGTWGTPVSPDLSPHLNPWITWVTVHTGVPHDVHGADVLEQPVESIHAKRSWQLAADAGLKVGVFGSVTSYPPEDNLSFCIPGPFAPGPETHPASLMPAQALNRVATRSDGSPSSRSS